MQQWLAAQLVGGLIEHEPRRIQPVQVTNRRRNPMGSIDIGLADLLEIFAALFGGSSEPEAN
jgi:hypothetical protein